KPAPNKGRAKNEPSARVRAGLIRASARLGASLVLISLGRIGRLLAGAAHALDRAARHAGFFRDLGVLLGDDGLGRLVAVETAERGGRHAPVRALGAVLVIHVEQHEFADGACAWFAS